MSALCFQCCIALNSNISPRYVSCIFACPYDGPTPPSAVLNCTQQLLAMGCYEVSLGDTLGVGVASDVQRLVSYLTSAGISVDSLAGHFHDTYGQAVANVWAAYQCGMRVFDSSVGGLGGCPYAPGAKGNVATEDLVYMLQQAGIETGVDLAKLVKIGVWISKELSKPNESRAGNALATRQKQDVSVSSTAKGPSQQDPNPASLPWASYKSEEGLEILRSGTNVKIILNRPRNGNALTTSMISSLTSFFETAALNPSITRIVLSARGKYFCTGMDLAKGSSPVSKGGSTSDLQYERLTRLFKAVDNAPQVTIACVQGPAFGGGVGLVFACDIRIMAKDAHMTLSEVKLGLCPATISKYVIREWGAPFAREAILSGRAVSASELAQLGKVVQVVETQTELPLVLDQYLTRLKTSAPRASAMGKDLVRLSWLDGGGGAKQAQGIRKLFNEMMAQGGEAAFGLEQFQAGNKAVDWDAHALAKSGVRAKL
jgi:hydroxymethylglutaryl-CoA lyase